MRLGNWPEPTDPSASYYGSMTRAGHRQLEHTADLALEIWAPSEPELLAEAARALVAIMTEDAAVEARETRQVRIAAIDRADRLVQWLNEVIVLAVARGFLVAQAEIVLEGEGVLEATVRGASAPKLATELKSATYHALSIAEDAPTGEWRAHVVVDV